MTVRTPTGVSPTSPRSAVRAPGEYVVLVVRASDGRVQLMDEPVPFTADDPERLLTVAECARLCGMQPASWRALVARGYAPPADDADEGRPVSRRQPRWKASTVGEFRRSRPGRGNKRREKPGAD